MPAASNDVIVTPPPLEFRHKVSFWHFLAMLVVIVVVCIPGSSRADPSFDHDSKTDPSPTPKSPATSYDQITLVHTNVVYICDSLSGEYCQHDTVQSWSLRDLYSFYSASNAKSNHSCQQTNSPCSFTNTSNTNKNDDKNNNALNSSKIVLQATLSDTVSLLIHISFHNVSGGVYELINELNELMAVHSSHVVICVGRDVTVQTTAIVADALGIPVIGYVTRSGTKQSNIQGRTYTGLNPGPEAQGMVLAQIIGKFNMKHLVVIVQDSKLADGFLHGIRKTNKEHRDEFHVLCLNSSASSDGLQETLMALSTTGWKLMVMHSDPDLMLKVIHKALSTRLYNTGHAWFLSQDAFTRDYATLSQLPEGLLAIESLWLGGVPDTMVDALDHLVTTFALFFRDGPTSAILNNVPYYSPGLHLDASNPSPSPSPSHNGFTEDILHISNWTWDQKDTKDFLRNLRTSVYCSRFLTVDPGDPQCNDDLLLQFINGSQHSHYHQPEGNHIHYNTTRRKKRKRAAYNVNEEKYATSDNHDIERGPAYTLLNTVTDGNSGLMWSKVGYITINGWQNLRTVLWPGHSIYGPAPNSVKTYRVVTRPAEPFVFISEQVKAKEECLIQMVCLQVFNTSKQILTKIVDDFQTGGRDVNDTYTIHCCWGIALELMQTLSQDLNFKFVLYFVNDTDYGTLQDDGVWTGMVGDLANGAADAIAGAFSITAQRMNKIHYTEPFYNNEYAQASGQDGNDVSIWAFTSPFSGQVWMCIFMSSIVAGIATAFLEWHSPFGLNPRGRKRTKNYGLGSGLLMVMVLITGHTINIKAPKSWPGKLIQNVWAGLAIFIMTSYTANLAAYLAGQSAVTSATNVFDPELVTKKVSVIASSAVETFLNKINPGLGKKTKEHYVESTYQAINLLSEREIDVYFDDTSLLEYALARYEKSCKVHISGKGFGSDGYAIGLAKQSWWLQTPMSNMIGTYTESGLVQELASKYISRPHCQNFVVGKATAYGLEHTGGLFFILLSSIFCSILLLVCEHLIYHFAVPWMRRQAPHSFWKTENLGFISQRVSRVVRSERLYSQKQAAQEMIKIVKQRDFTRLIQKNELQKRKTPVQKKVKTKAEVFQEITANIISYHRQLQSASEDADTVASSENADCVQQGPSSVDSAALDTPGFSSELAGVSNTGYATDSVELAVDDYYLRQISDCEEEDSRETAFTFDNPCDIPADICENECSHGLSQPRRMSSKSWTFAPRQLPENSALQRHSTFRLPLKPVKKKAAIASSQLSHVPLQHESHRTETRTSPSKQSEPCDNQQQPFHNRRNVELFHCADSDNEMDTSLPPPVLSMSSLCLSSFSANSSLFFPSPPSSQVQSPMGDKRPNAILITTTPEDRTRDSSVMPELPEQYAIQEANANHLQLPSPRVPEVPLDPAILDAAHSPNSLSEINSLTNNSQSADQLINTETPSQHDEGCSNHPLSLSNSSRLYNDHGSVDSVFVDLPTDPENVQIETHNESNSKRSKGVPEMDKNVRKYSDLRDYRLPTSNLSGVNITQRRKSYDKQSRDYFKRNIKLKDNRVKSTLRHHVMSGYQSTLPADFIDECTLEALSKEDLLVLWKKSEIELEGRLNEVLERNRRLGCAIEFLSQSEKQERLTEV